jgi:hypothetical protein
MTDGQQRSAHKVSLYCAQNTWNTSVIVTGMTNTISRYVCDLCAGRCCWGADSDSVWSGVSSWS